MSDTQTAKATTIQSPPRPTLADLAADIDRLNEEIEQAFRQVIERVFEAGNKLNNVKDLVGHGHFGAWLKTNCKLPERTAQRYMRVADHRKEIEEKLKFENATVADISLRQAERLITKSPPPDEEKNRPVDPPMSLAQSTFLETT